MKLRAARPFHGVRQRRSLASGCALALGLAGVAAAATPATAAVDALPSFAHDPVLSAEELSKLRGGFILPTGGLVQFGVQIQQYVNNTLENDVSIGLVQNNFTVTQTTPATGTQTSQLTQLPTGGLSFPISVNGGATNLAVTVANNSFQTVIQNQASNQAIRSVTTVNIATQGFVAALHGGMTTAQLLQTIQNNSWLHH